LANKVVFYLAGNQKLRLFNLSDQTFDPDLTQAVTIKHRFDPTAIINLKN